MITLPTVFVSHGAPTLVTDHSRSVDFFRTLATQLPRPRAILCISAHWETEEPRVSGAVRPPTIHDFYGFPPELYKFDYPAPGDPVLAQTIQKLLSAADLPCVIDPQRGLDHGAWVPLLLTWPQADIPVVQFSVQPHLDPMHHYNLGRALQPLREQGVLIFASGAATHNLRGFRGQAMNTAPPDYVLAFDAWLTSAVTRGAVPELLDYAAQAPEALQNHPTPEHFLPLFVALGAATDARAEVLHQDYNYGLFSMSAFRWN